MKNLSKRLLIVAVVVLGSLGLNSCTDNNEKLISEIEQSTTPGNNGEVDTEDEEETGNE